MPFMGKTDPDKDLPSNFDAGELLREFVAVRGLVQTYFIAGAALLERGYKLSVGVTKKGNSIFIGFGKGEKFYCAFGKNIDELNIDLGELLSQLDAVEKGLQNAVKSSYELYKDAHDVYWREPLDK